MTEPQEGVILPTLEAPTLTKAELADLLFDRLGLNKRESKDMVEAFFEIVHGSLVEGHDVQVQRRTVHAWRDFASLGGNLGRGFGPERSSEQGRGLEPQGVVGGGTRGSVWMFTVHCRPRRHRFC